MEDDRAAALAGLASTVNDTDPGPLPLLPV
jgi:hypothetical protein